MTRRLVVNADDFGLSPLVNDGIAEAVEAGSLTSLSVMVNTPGFDDAMRRAPALRGRVGLGLHFNLTTGRPVAPASAVPTLVDGAGRFLPLAALARRTVAGGVRPDDVWREADAQLARLVAGGVAPTHVDSHRHVHALATIRGPLGTAARAAGVAVMRRPLEPAWAPPWTAAAVAKRVALAAAWAAPVSGALPPAGTDHFRGLALLGRRRYADDLLALLDVLPEGSTELMVHPGRDDPSAAAWDPYVAGRAVELAALLSPAVRARLSRGDLELSPFRPDAAAGAVA